MIRLLGTTALALLATCVASAPVEAQEGSGRGLRRGGAVHGARYARSGGYRGGYGGAWRGVRPGYGYGVSAYPGGYQDYGSGGYGYGYGGGGWWAPMAAAAMIVPIAAAAAQSDYPDSSIGGSCATPARTCQLYSAAPVGTGCSCKVPGGRMRGVVE
jgi:hypothetical protein